MKEEGAAETRTWQVLSQIEQRCTCGLLMHVIY